MATTFRSRVTLAAGAAVVAFAAVAGLVTFRAVTGRAEAPGAAAAAAATPSPTPVTVATPTVSLPAPKPAAPTPEPPPLPRIGPISADPVRVATGDGDCLNVRPQPGTTFKTDPRACVPEGYLLWLTGPAQAVDGEQWRYALGEGWVAVRYTKADPAANKLFAGKVPPVVLSATNGMTTSVARITPDGAVTKLRTLNYAAQGLGALPLLVSASGEFAAYGKEERYVPTVTVLGLADGSERKYPGAYPAGWGPDGKLLVRIVKGCPQVCGISELGWIDARAGEMHTLQGVPKNTWLSAWAPDGKSLIVITEERTVLRAPLDGPAVTLVAKLPDGQVQGEIALSPDGTRLLSNAVQGPVQVLDLRTGTITNIERTRQQPVLGRCGGGYSGPLSVWLDDATVVWHEAYGEKGTNGITVAGLAGGARRVLPFFSVAGVQRVAPGVLSFGTINPVDGSSVPVTWLLDVRTGDARPIAIGQDARWER